jgi:hypothetical protein
MKNFFKVRSNLFKRKIFKCGQIYLRKIDKRRTSGVLGNERYGVES